MVPSMSSSSRMSPEFLLYLHACRVTVLIRGVWLIIAAVLWFCPLRKLRVALLVLSPWLYPFVSLRLLRLSSPSWMSTFVVVRLVLTSVRRVNGR